MKNARPPLPSRALSDPNALLTTGDAARLLRVHPKHIYRLLRRGLPGRRVGGEWRFVAGELLRWSGGRPVLPDAAPLRDVDLDGRGEGPRVEATPAVPPLLAANGDIAVERLLSRLNGAHGVSMGFVQADRGEALELLRRGAVLAAGYHGGEIPAALTGHRLAFVQLVDRQVGFAVRAGFRLRSLRQLGKARFASRPATAGIRDHFDEEARRQGVDPQALHAGATIMSSHREVACAVARGEADVGLSSEAWARHVGLHCIPLRREAYGLLVRASALGDPRIVHLCEVAQSAAFRREVGGVPGYSAANAGRISYPASKTPAPDSP